MADSRRSLWSLVFIPAVVSAIVTVVRLAGEMLGWNETLFGKAGPGGNEQQGLFGISWLIPIFGFWFGLKLRGIHGEPPHAGKALLVLLLAAGVFAGGMWGLGAAELVVFPSTEKPGEAKGFEYMLGLMALTALIALLAWPRLGRTLFVYAVLARIPVVVVTYLALDRNWDTHYTKLPAGMTLPEGVSKFAFLAMPQMTFWIGFTMLAGGICGCIAAGMTRKSRAL
ncbi:MAG: hypothetical protein AB7I19_11730 [Planctomycetota bacterium]